MSGLPIFSLVALLAAGAAVYQTSALVDTRTETLQNINTAILQEQETARVLAAEWALLAAAPRIERLARTYLDMQPLTPDALTLASRWRDDLRQDSPAPAQDAAPSVVDDPEMSGPPSEDAPTDTLVVATRIP